MENKQKEIDLSKVVLVLKDNRKQIGIATAVTTLLAIVYCIFATPIFTAKTIINPPKLTDAGSGAAQALSGLAVLAGGGGGLLSQKTDADVTIAILKTTALKDMIINQFNLQKLWEKKDIELTRLALDDNVKFIPDMKSGFVEIDVDDENPKMAANIANYYNLALGQMISNISYGRSNTKYQFYQSQLTGAESAMNAAENDLKVFAESNGFIAGQQIQIVASLSAQLQAQLIVAQAQLQSMSMYASPDNPDYQQLESQIGSYKIQLDNMNVSGTPDPIGIPATRAPALAQKYANLMREYMLRQEVYKIIVKQYEANRLDTLSELAPVGIQVVDPAQAPLYKSKPKRLKIVLGAVVLGALLSSVFMIIRNRKRIIVEVDNEKQIN
ncbi:MAG: hypothetical protein K2X04_01505 [Burkholderiales bacterium]|nr:hypothetical protein [Burkholderiales bacterium]